jgi:hypothetical protein
MNERDLDTKFTYTNKVQVAGGLATKCAGSICQVSDLQKQISAAVGNTFAPVAQTCGSIVQGIKDVLEGVLTAMCACQQSIGDYANASIASKCGSIMGTCELLQATEQRGILRCQKKGQPVTMSTADAGMGPYQAAPQSSPVLATGSMPSSGAGQNPAPSFLPPWTGFTPPTGVLPDLWVPVGAAENPPGMRLRTFTADWFQSEGQSHLFFSLSPTPITRFILPMYEVTDGNTVVHGQIYLNAPFNLPDNVQDSAMAALGVPQGVYVSWTNMDAYTNAVANWACDSVQQVYNTYGIPIPMVDAAGNPLCSPISPPPPPPPPPPNGTGPQTGGGCDPIAPGMPCGTNGTTIAPPPPPPNGTNGEECCIPICGMPPTGSMVGIFDNLNLPTLADIAAQIFAVTKQQICTVMTPVYQQLDLDPTKIWPCATLDEMDAYLRQGRGG